MAARQTALPGRIPTPPSSGAARTRHERRRGEPRPCSAPRPLGGAPANPGAGAEAGGGSRAAGPCAVVGRCLFRAALSARPCSTAVLLLQSLLSLYCPPFSSRSRGRPSPRSASPHSPPRARASPHGPSPHAHRAQTRAGNPARSHRPLRWPCPPSAVPHVSGISQLSRQTAGFSPAAPAKLPCGASSGTRLPAASQSGGAALCSSVARSRGVHLCCPLQVTSNCALGINEGLLGALLKLAVVTVSAALPGCCFCPALLCEAS